MLRDHGLESFSLRALAKAAGFSPAALYEYFDNKAAIVDAVQDLVDVELSTALREAAESEPPGRRRVTAVLLRYLAYAKENREEFLVLFSRLGSKAQSLQDSPHQPFQVLMAAVKDAEAEGDLRIRDGMPLEGVTYGLWAAAHGMAMLQATYLQTFEADFDLVDKWMLIDFLRGLRP